MSGQERPSRQENWLTGGIGLALTFIVMSPFLVLLLAFLSEHWRGIGVIAALIVVAICAASIVIRLRIEKKFREDDGGK